MRWFFWRSNDQSKPDANRGALTQRIEDDDRRLAVLLGSAKLKPTSGKKVHRNADGLVIDINLAHCQLAGSLVTSALPRQLVKVSFCGNALTGRLDFTDLPPTLHRLDVSQNRFVGELNLTKLPPELTELNIAHNAFTGVLELGSLPRQLTALYANNNGFEFIVTSTAEALLETRARMPDFADEAGVQDEHSRQPDAPGPRLMTLGHSAYREPVSAFRAEQRQQLGGLVLSDVDFDLMLLPRTLRYLNVEGNPATATQGKPSIPAGAKLTLWWGAAT